MSDKPQKSGWYLARRIIWPSTAEPVVVRVTCDEAGGVTTIWMIGSRDPSTLNEWTLVEKIKRDGRTIELNLDRELAEAQADGVRQGREEAKREQVECEAKRNRERPTYEAWTAEPHQRPFFGSIISVRMVADDAEKLSNALSDLLCWTQGFKAALGPDDFSRAPMGVEAVRTIRETIMKAQRAMDGARA